MTSCTKKSVNDEIPSTTTINITETWKYVGYYDDTVNPNPVPNYEENFYSSDNPYFYTFSGNTFIRTNNTGQVLSSGSFTISNTNLLTMNSTVMGTVFLRSPIVMQIGLDYGSPGYESRYEKLHQQLQEKKINHKYNLKDRFKNSVFFFI